MADESDVLISMALDLTKVREQVDTVKKMFKELNDGSVFNNLNRATGPMVTNIKNVRSELAGLRNDIVALNRIKFEINPSIKKSAEATTDLGVAASTAAAKVKTANKEIIASNTEVAESFRKVKSPILREALGGRMDYAAKGFGVQDQIKAGNRSVDVREWTRQLRSQAEYLSAQKVVNDLVAKEVGDRESIAEVQRQINAEAKEYADIQKTIKENNAFSAQEQVGNQLRAAQVIARDINRQGGIRAAATNLFNEADGAMSMEQALSHVRGLADEAEKYGFAIRRSTSFWDVQIQKFGQHLVQWTAWGAIMGTTFAVLEGISKTMSTIVKESSEFQVQSVMFGASQKAAQFVGDKSPLINSNAMLTDAIRLATQYGDHVNTVAQDLQLWTKQTNDYNAALALTNETLKFHLATGTQLEDVYRTITALQSQASSIPFSSGDSKGFTLADVPQLLQEITSESLVMGAGLHQVSEAGTEMGNSLNNSAILYLKALEQDAAALASLHYSVEDSIALNAALIQAFGNTGVAAEEAGDKLQRIVGGLERLSTSSGVAGLKKAGMSVQDINKYLFSGGDILEKFAKDWDKLGTPMQNYISLAIGGTRQTDAFHTVLEAYSRDIDKARKALQDKNAEDDLANQMAGTYQVQTQRLNAAWEGFSIVIGTMVMPAMTALIQYVTNTAIPEMESMIGLLALSGKFATMIPAANVAKAKELRPSADLLKNQKAVVAADKQLLASDSLESDIKRDQAKLQADQAYLNNLFALEANYQKIRGQAASQRAELSYYFGFSGNAIGTAPQNYVNRFGYTKAQWEKLGHSAKSFTATDPNLDLHKARVSGNLDILGQGIYAGWQGAMNPNQVFDAAAALEKYRDLAKKVHFPGPQAPPDASSTKGVAKDYQDYADAVRDGSAATALYIDRQKLAVMADESHIKVLQEKLKIEPQNLSLVKQIIATSDDRVKHLNEENAGINANILGLQGQINHAKDMANASPKGSTERDGWLRTADQLTQKLIEQKNAFQANRDAAAEAGSTIQNSLQTTLDTFNKKLTGDYSRASKDKNLLGQLSDLKGLNNDLYGFENQLRSLLPSIKDPALKNFIQQWISDEDTKRLETVTQDVANFKQQLDGMKNLGEDMSSNTWDSLATVTGMPQNQLDYFKNLQQIQKQYVDYGKQIDDYATKFPDQAKDLLALRDSWFEAATAAAQYEEHVKKIQDSALYQAASSAFDSMASTASTSLTASLFGDTAKSVGISNIDQQISGIERLKTEENDWYQAQQYHTAVQEAAHKSRLEQYDLEIQKLREKAQAEKDALAHPPLLKKIAEDFSKNVMDSMFKQMANSALKKLFGLDENKELVKALEDQVASTQSQLVPAMQSYDLTTQNLNKIMVNWSNSVDKLDQDVTALAQTIATGSMGQDPAKAAIAQAAASGFSFSQSSNENFNFSTTPITSIDLKSGGASSVFSGMRPADAAGAIALMGLAATGGGFGLSSIGGSSNVPQAVKVMNAIATAKGGGSNIMAAAQLFSAFHGFDVNSFDQKWANTGIGAGSPWASLVKGGSHHISAGGIAGALMAAYAGYEQGGLAGASMGGLGVGLDVLAMTGNPLLAAGAGLADFVGTLLLGNHDNPAKMPDKYNTASWGQANANLWGAGVGINTGNPMIANGQTFTMDSQLAQMTGNKGELQYISDWIKANPTLAAQVLSPTQLKDFSNLNDAKPIPSGKDGNLTLSNGITMNWQDLASAADAATQAILNFTNAANSSSQGLISLNMFGATSAYFPYAWGTPGFDGTIPPSQNNYPYPGTTPPSTSPGDNPPGTDPGSGDPTTGPGGRPIPVNPRDKNLAYAYHTFGGASATTQEVVVHATLPVSIDGRQATRVMQSYQLRATAAGNARVV